MAIFAKNQAPVEAPNPNRLTLLIELGEHATEEQLQAAAREALRTIRLSVHGRARAYQWVPTSQHTPNRQAVVRYGSLWQEIKPSAE